MKIEKTNGEEGKDHQGSYYLAGWLGWEDQQGKSQGERKEEGELEGKGGRIPADLGRWRQVDHGRMVEGKQPN